MAFVSQPNRILGQVLGVVGGTVGLFEQSTVEITDELLAAYRNQGGFDLLGRSVDSIRTDAEMAKAKEACAALDLDGLVVGFCAWFGVVFLLRIFIAATLVVFYLVRVDGAAWEQGLPPGGVREMTTGSLSVL